MRSELATTAPDVSAQALDDICTRAEQANTAAHDVLVALVTTLADPDLAARVEEIRVIAERDALLAVGRLLRGARSPSGPAASDDETGPLKDGRTGRPLTLGERKALARQPSRASFDRLLRDPHPMVIRTLLKNPRLTEDDVVRLAARRPANTEVIEEIARNAAWAKRARVRLAIVFNPGSPTSVSVPMVRLLIRPELLDVASAAALPAIVRAAATELLARRPPVPARRDGSTH